ncbi:MAG: RNA methyltransferase [Clostridiales bacterium]|nr:RNA methyltransferase [Clostridiales bacterium]
MSNGGKPVSYLKLLKQKKYRDDTGLFLAEGEKFIDEIPVGTVLEYFISQSYSAKNPGFVRHTKENVTVLKDSVFESVSANKTPQGRIALCRKMKNSLTSLLADKGNTLYILAEEINDPGNLGTIIRTSYAAGAAGVITSKGSAELYNPKTLQSAAGAIFKTPVIENADFNEVLPLFAQNGITVYAADIAGAVSLFDTDFTKPCAFLLGSEARGLSENALKLSGKRVFIPMPGGAQSLNVSAACAVFVYEALRQRIKKEDIYYAKSNSNI